MVLKFFSILLGVLLFSALSLSSETAYQAPLVNDSLLLDVAKRAGGLVAVGERGHILTSNDGQQWQQQSVPTTATLTGIYFVGDKGWAVGHDTTILHTAGKGQPWQLQMQDIALEKPLLDVYFKDENNGIAIGAYGIFYRTTDGGANWVAEQHAELLHPDDFAYLEEIREEDEAFYLEELSSILPHFNRISAAGDRLFLAGESGLLAFSDDFGKKWQRMPIDYSGSFFDVVQNQQGRLLAAGLRGNIFSYDEINQRWDPVKVDTTSSFNSIVVGAEGSFWVLGNNGYVVNINNDKVTLSQTEDGQAIVNAVDIKGKLIAVTATGVKAL